MQRPSSSQLLLRPGATICECERGTEHEQVACFVAAYEHFQTLRGGQHDKQQRDKLRGLKRFCDIQLGQLTCDNTSDEVATSLILQSFLDTHCSTHPTFARCAPPSNFAAKIDFFKNI